MVVDSNRRDDLAVVKLYSKSGTRLPVSGSGYKLFVETLANENNRIRVGWKFVRSRQRLSPTDVTIIKKDCFTNPFCRYKNKKRCAK